MIPKLKTAIQGDQQSVFEGCETLVTINDKCVPQRAGFYLLKTDPVSATPLSTAAFNYRDWETLKEHPDCKFRRLYEKSNLLEGRQLRIGNNEVWTAAIVVEKRQSEQDTPLTTTTTATLPLQQQQPIHFAAIHPGNGPQVGRKLLRAYHSQEIGKNTGQDGKSVFCLQNAAKWCADFPEIVTEGNKVDFIQLNMVHLAVVKELIDELIIVKKQVADLNLKLAQQ